MILLLRLGAFALNVGFVAAAALLAGAPAPAVPAVVAALAALSWWGCGRAPAGDPAPEAIVAAARALASELGAAPPRFVCMHPGWFGAAVRDGVSYGLLLGREVREDERRAVLAHEIAHAASGDLLWEPFTDGPARLLQPVLAGFPPLALPLCPLLLLGVPLARATELAADRRAASVVPGYAAALERIAALEPRGASPLYPSIRERIRVSARNS
jgi:hypothetical protein